MKMRETSRDTDKKPCVNNYLTWANQIRLLTLNIQQLAATIGQGLIAAVLPALQALNKLFNVLQKVAVAVRNFFYVLTGYKGGGSSGIVNDLTSIGDASSGLEDLGSSGSDAAGGLGEAAKAAEELKNATLGIDELNIISPNEPASTSGSGGSGGGGTGGDGGTDLGFNDGLFDLGDTDQEKYVSPWAERIRKAFLAEDWEGLGEEIAWGLNKGLQKVYDVISWKNVGPKITAFTTAFTETFNSFAQSFDFDLLGRTIGTGINTVVNTINNLIDGIDWKNLGSKFAVGLNGLVGEVNWYELGRLIGNKFMIAWDTLLGFVTTLDWGEVGRSLADGFNGMLEEVSLGDIGTTIGTIVAGVIEMFREFFANADWGEVADQIKEGISNALKAASDGGKNDGIIGIIFGGLALGGIAKISGPIISVITTISDLLGKTGLTKSAGQAAGALGGSGGLTGVLSKVAPKLSGLAGPIGIAVAAILAIGAGIKDLWDTSESFRNVVGNVWESICESFSYAKEQIWDNTLAPLGEQIGGLFSSIYDFYESSGLKDLFEFVISNALVRIGSIISTVLKVIGDAFEAIGGMFSGILESLQGVIDFLVGVFTGNWEKAWNGIKDVVGGFADAVKSIFEGIWNIIVDIFTPVINFFSTIFGGAYEGIKTAFQFIGSWFKERWNDIKNAFGDVADFFGSAFGAAYDAITSVWEGITGFFKGLFNGVLDVVAGFVNGIGGAINWVADLLGLDPIFGTWEPEKFASGSRGIQRDTFGIVNDQKGATYKELILPPNGKPFIPKGRNVMLPLQKGTKIMPAGQTEEFMKLMKIPRFKGGIGDFFGDLWNGIKEFAGNVWHYLTNPGELVKIALEKFIKIGDLFEPWISIAGGAINKLFDSLVDFVSGLFNKATPEVNYSPSAGVDQWRDLAAQALQMTGQYSESNLNLLLYQMQTESGGNPNAINNWDINAQNGTPSKGLMQVIDPTFKAYAYPGYDTNIWDPLSNILAAIRYTLSRYGSLANGWKGHGYASGIGKINLSDLFGEIPKLAGGGVVMPGQLFVANERGPELLGRYGNRTTVMNNDQVVTSVSSGVEKAVERQNAEMTLLLRQILETNQRILEKDNSINLDGKRTNRLLDRAKSNAGYGFRRTVTAT